MPEELPSGDRAVYVFIEMIALGFVLYAIEEGFKNNVSWTKVGIASALGILFFLIGINWARLKQELWAFVVKPIDRIAADYRFRYGLPLLLLGAGAVYGIIALHSIRQILDIYVMPRVVTPEQSEALKSALLASPSDKTINIFTDSTNQEATEYGGELLNAIRSGGWTANFEPINPWDSIGLSAFAGTRITKAFVMSMRGLAIESCLVGQPTNPDPKHPAPDQMLRDAFKKARIEVSQTGEAADCGQYSLVLVVGKRPRTIGEQLPISVRLANWLIHDKE